MNNADYDAIAEHLAESGFRGLFVVTRGGVVTIEGALPPTDEALKALEGAFAAHTEHATDVVTEDAVAT